MVTVSGFTKFGIIRKRMADLFADFALRIKETGVFGTQTTVDAPDLFPTDPLVQIMSTTSASLHELWEATELWYSQLDPRTASGVYLESLHGLRLGITRADGQSDSEYRAAILAAFSRPARTDIVTVATARPDIDCAVLLTSTVENPIEGIPTPGNALVVKGCNIDYQALAADLYTYVDLGVHHLYGEVAAFYATSTGGCVPYRFIEAKPVFVGVEVHGYYTADCGLSPEEDVLAAIYTRLRDTYSECGLGVGFNSATAALAIGAVPGFIVTSVNIARRAKQLWPADCPTDDAARVTICGNEVIWATSTTCGFSAGEVWCPSVNGCLDILPWEHVAFDPQFITLVQDTTDGGCL